MKSLTGRGSVACFHRGIESTLADCVVHGPMSVGTLARSIHSRLCRLDFYLSHRPFKSGLPYVTARLR